MAPSVHGVPKGFLAARECLMEVTHDVLNVSHTFHRMHIFLKLVSIANRFPFTAGGCEELGHTRDDKEAGPRLDQDEGHEEQISQ